MQGSVGYAGDLGHLPSTQRGERSTAAAPAATVGRLEFRVNDFEVDELSHSVLMRWRVPLVNDAWQVMIYVHNKRVIHRDLKPRNILVSDRKVVKLIDFGLGPMHVPTC